MKNKFFSEFVDEWRSTSRSSRSEACTRITVLKNYVIFTRKHLRWYLFLVELQAKVTEGVENGRNRRCCSLNFSKFSKTVFLIAKLQGDCFYSYSVLQKKKGYHHSFFSTNFSKFTEQVFIFEWLLLINVKTFGWQLDSWYKLLFISS